MLGEKYVDWRKIEETKKWTKLLSNILVDVMGAIVDIVTKMTPKSIMVIIALWFNIDYVYAYWITISNGKSCLKLHYFIFKVNILRNNFFGGFEF